MLLGGTRPHTRDDHTTAMTARPRLPMTSAAVLNFSISDLDSGPVGLPA